MLPILNIGPLALQFPGLLLLLGIWIGLSLAERHTQRFQINANDLYNLALGSLIAVVVGARLVYIIRYSEVFLASPTSAFSLNPGLLDGTGAATGALVFALFYAQRKHMPLWQTLDALTPALAVGAIAWHLANLASGSAFGSPSTLPWSIDLWNAQRHPVQAYEALAACLILALRWPGAIKTAAYRPGAYFLSLAALSAASRLFFEAFRGDSLLLPGGFRSAQLIAWAVLAASLFMLMRKEKPAQTGQTTPEKLPPVEIPREFFPREEFPPEIITPSNPSEHNPPKGGL